MDVDLEKLRFERYLGVKGTLLEPLCIWYECADIQYYPENPNGDMGKYVVEWTETRKYRAYVPGEMPA